MVRHLAAERGASGGGIAEEAGRRLGVRWVATGGFQRVGEKLRITARLSDAGTGDVVRALKLDGDLADLFVLQDRLAAGLAEALREASGSTAIVPAAADETRSVEAFEAYSKGLIDLREASAASLERATDLFRRATVLDPRYAAAWISLAWALQDRAEYLGLTAPSEEALGAFRRALELRPSSAETYRGLAYTYLHLRRDDEALASAKTAFSLAPGEAAAHQALARVLFVAKGQFLEAARAYEAALALNPQGGWIALQLSHCLALAGELPRADAAARIAIRLQEESLSGKEGLRIVGAHVRLAHVHALAGRHAEAVAELEAEQRFLATVGHALAARALVELNVRLGSALGRLGRESEARAALAEALTRFRDRLAKGVDDPFTRYYAAQGCVLLGETEAALALLVGAAAQRPALTLRRALVEPDFTPLRSEPEFRRLLAEHGIAAA
jgi:tetratricopeptide (TPR) repeat protein